VRHFPFYVFAIGILPLGCAPPANELRVDPARECQTAAQLRAPSDAGGPHMSRTLWRVHECPEQAGAIVAELLTSSRSEQDTVEVQRATSLAQYVHDGRVLAAALAVALDSAATVAARLGGLRAMLWAKAPGHPYYSLSSLLTPPRCVRPRCFSSYTSHFYGGGPVAGATARWPVFGYPMPKGFVSKINSAAAMLEGDPGAPKSIRDAARHVQIFPADPEVAYR
jgi:hypothetical protein